MEFHPPYPDLHAYAPLLRGYLNRSFSKLAYLRDDLVQETYLEAYGSICNRGPPASPVPWLVTIAKRVALRTLKREHRKPRNLDGEEPRSWKSSPLEQLVTQEQFQRCLDALHRLPSFQRYVLDAFYVERRSCREIAEELGTTRDNIKTILYRGRRKLRGLLQEEEGEP